MSTSLPTTRLSTKGRIVLPLNIRNARAWEPGTQFTVEETVDGILLRPARLFAETCLGDVTGSLKPGRRMSASKQDMDVAISTEVRRRHELGRY